MNKEEVDRTISLLIHQNICVVNNGTKEYPDLVVGGTDLLKKELSKLFSLNIVSQQRELLNALANDFNESTDTYVGQKTIEKTLKAFNCG